MRIGIVFVGGIPEDVKDTVKNLASEAFPRAQFDIKDMTGCNSLGNVIFLTTMVRELSRSAMNRLILTDKKIYDIAITYRTVSSKMENVMKYTSQSQLRGDLNRKWHIGKGMIFNDEAIQASTRPDESETDRLKRELDIVKRERDQLRISKVRSVMDDDYKRLQERYNQLYKDNTRALDDKRSAESKLITISNELDESRRKERNAYERGYEEGQKDNKTNLTGDNILYQLSQTNDIKLSALPRIPCKGKHDSIHLLFCGTARTECQIYKAIEEDIKDSESKKTKVLFDLTNEAYSPVVFKIPADKVKPLGYRWLMNPDYRTLRQYTSPIYDKSIDLLLANSGQVYSRHILLTMNWQKIFDVIESCNIEAYFYLGELSNIESLILALSLDGCCKDIAVYFEACTGYETAYMQKLLKMLPVKGEVDLVVYNINQAVKGMLNKIAQNGIELFNGEYQFMKQRRRPSR